MELRACSLSHFIASISGGKVIKILSSVQRKKGPKFRSIEEIYFSNDSNCHDSLPKVNRSLAMPCGLDNVKNKVKSEYKEENELEFEGLTLRQLKDICESHNRKASRYVNMKTIKQEDGDLQSEVDDLELMETLGSLKCKVLKKTKARKKGISKSSSYSSTINKLSGGLDNTSANLAVLDITSEIITPRRIKVEDEEYDFSEPQARSFVHEPEISTSEADRAFEHCCPDQDLNLSSGYQQSGFLDQVSHEHLKQPVYITKSICCLNQVSYEHMDNVDPQNPLISEDLETEESIKEDNSVILSEKPLVFSGSDVRREVDMIDHMSCDDPIAALLEADGSSFQVDHPHYRSQIIPVPEENGSSDIDAPCMTLNSDCEDAEFTNPSEVSLDDNRDIEVGTRNATNFNSVVKLDNYIHSADGMPSLVKPTFVVEDKQLLVLNVSTESVPTSSMIRKRKFQDTECFNIGEDSTCTVEIVKNSKNYNIAVQDENLLTSVRSVESLQNVTSAIEDKQSSIVDTSIGTLTCSPDNQPCIAADHHIGSASDGLYENKPEQQPPERLFSARKTISPNSKEKLRRAMVSAEMQDDTQILFSERLKATTCREKLFLEKNAVHTLPSRSNLKKARIVLTSKRLHALHTIQTRPNSIHTLKKGETEKKLSDIKGTVNSPRVFPSSVQASRACSSSRSCFQNAIAFSQQQMVDIERLATKLLMELQTMKEMIVDTLHPDSRTCSTSRFNSDKARLAVTNVKKVEDTTKRWLSMMARDCNRFCKIMELSEKNDAYPQKSNDECIPDSELWPNNLKSETKLNEEKVSPLETSVRKERKITFADEAGETLCHIRVL